MAEKLRNVNININNISMLSLNNYIFSQESVAREKMGG
jgi:hypothetical protein